MSKTPTVSFETITPTMARKALALTEKAGFNNRPLTVSAVHRYAHEMREGRWFQPAVEPIHFSTKNGIEICVNGQHRLQAIIESNVSLKCLVVRGVAYDAFKYFDGGGNSRDLKDIIAVDSTFKNPQAAATAMRLLFKEDVTGNPTVRPDARDNFNDANVYQVCIERYNGSIERVYEDHEALLARIERTTTVNGAKMSGLGPKGVYLYFAVRALKRDSNLLSEVLTYLSDDVKLAAPDKGWKEYVRFVRLLREEAEGKAGKILKGRHKDFSDTMLAALVLTWNRSRSAERPYTLNSLTAAVDSLPPREWPGIV